MSAEIQPFDHRISAELAALIPDEVRSDSNRLQAWVDESLKFGLKAMLQTAIGIDTSLVGNEFDRWANDIQDQLIGKDSELLRGLDGWINDSTGGFQVALDMGNPQSPMGKFMDKIDGDLGEHQEAVETLIGDLQKQLQDQLSDMRVHLGMEEATKAEAEKGTQKGTKFEEEVAAHLNANKGPVSDSIGVVGTMLIDGTQRKVGDVLSDIEAPRTSNLKIVIEVKAGSDFTMEGKHTLPDQMKESIDLRQAHAAIAVIDIKHLKKKMKPFMEIDRKRILVAVDRENSDFTLLDIAYSILRYRIIENTLTGVEDVAVSVDMDRVQELLSEIISTLEITRKLGRNCTDAAKSVEGIRSDIVQMKIDIENRAKDILLLIKQASNDSESE